MGIATATAAAAAAAARTATDGPAPVRRSGRSVSPVGRGAPVTIHRVAGHELTQLEGGERIVSERIRGARSVAIGLWIGVGSRDEPANRAGVAHFVEHLLFKGSSRHTALEIAELTDRMGGELNAATSRETTCLYTRVPESQAHRALDLMLDMAFEPTFADIDTEREVVLEEIAMVDDQPQDLVHDLAAEALYPGHPLGRPVIGSADVISSISRDALQSFHRHAYHGTNIVLAAAGNVRHEDLVNRARRDPSRMTASRRGRAVGRTARPAVRFLRRPTEQYHVVLTGPGLRIDDPRRYAAAVLDTIVGGSGSSRLFQEIREKRGMAYSVYSDRCAYRETGQVVVCLGTRGANVASCLGVIGHELRELGRGNLREGELARARETIEAKLLLAEDSIPTRMNRLGRAIVSGAEIVSLDETLRRLRAVTDTDVTALARDLFDPANLSVAAIGPRATVIDRAVERLRVPA